MLDIAGAGEHVTKCQEEAKINKDCKLNFHSFQRNNSQTEGGKSGLSVNSSASLDASANPAEVQTYGQS